LESNIKVLLVVVLQDGRERRRVPGFEWEEPDLSEGPHRKAGGTVNFSAVGTSDRGGGSGGNCPPGSQAPREKKRKRNTLGHRRK